MFTLEGILTHASMPTHPHTNARQKLQKTNQRYGYKTTRKITLCYILGISTSIKEMQELKKTKKYDNWTDIKVDVPQ